MPASPQRSRCRPARAARHGKGKQVPLGCDNEVWTNPLRGNSRALAGVSLGSTIRVNR